MPKEILLVSLEGAPSSVLAAFDSINSLELFTAGYKKYRPDVKFTVTAVNYYENLPSKGTS